MVIDQQQFDLCGKHTFVKAKVKPPFKLPYVMPDEACFFYLIEGGGTLFGPTKKLEIEAKDGVVMQCGNYLLELLKEDKCEYCEAIAIHLHPDVLKMIFEKGLPDFLVKLDKVTPVVYHKAKSSKLLKNYINSLQFYFENPALVSEELLSLKIKELMLLLAKTEQREVIKNLIQGLFSPVAIDFKEVIDNHLYENLSIEQLAVMTSLSVSSFKRTFAKHYRTTPAKYLRTQKLAKAAKLLKGTDLRISSVAYDCGFVDLAHFSKTFNKEYGMSPSEYRVV